MKALYTKIEIWCYNQFTNVWNIKWSFNKVSLPAIDCYFQTNDLSSGRHSFSNRDNFITTYTFAEINMKFGKWNCTTLLVACGRPLVVPLCHAELYQFTNIFFSTLHMKSLFISVQTVRDRCRSTLEMCVRIRGIRCWPDFCIGSNVTTSIDPTSYPQNFESPTC